MGVPVPIFNGLLPPNFVDGTSDGVAYLPRSAPSNMTELGWLFTMETDYWPESSSKNRRTNMDNLRSRFARTKVAG